MMTFQRWPKSLAYGLVLISVLSGCSLPSAAAPVNKPLTIHSEAPVSEPIVTWSEAPTPETVATASLSSPTVVPSASTVTSTPSTPEPQAGTVLSQLANIQVKGQAPKSGYDRDLFGAGWKDPDRNGCDARNDVLGRDLEDTTVKPGTQGCVIATGVLGDPFTGTSISFVRGQGTSAKVQIDHVVALSDAWQKGAQQMSAQERLEFANDPINLLAVDGPTNASKGDGDAATWLPPKKSFRCEYVARQTAVKAKYGLWMTKAEHAAIQGIINSQCPDRKVVPFG